jgi:hypothetical protein
MEWLENIREYVYVITDGGYCEKYMIYDWSLHDALKDFKKKLEVKYATKYR